MKHYTDNLRRFGFTDADFASTSHRLVDALMAETDAHSLQTRLAQQRAAGAHHVVIQFVPPPPPERALELIEAAPLPTSAGGGG